MAPSHPSLVDFQQLRMFPVRQLQVVQVVVPPGVSGDHIQVLLVHVASDNQVAVPATLEKKSPSLYLIQFEVEKAGNYALDVAVSGRRLKDCPVACKAYDAARIQLTNVPQSAEVGKPVQFHVDASKAGEGQLEISINKGEVANKVDVLSSGRCIVSFTPENPIVHTVEIRFNGDIVPGCPLNIIATESTANYSVDLSKLDLVPLNQPVLFPIRIPRGRRELIRVMVLSPKNNSVPVSLKAAHEDPDVVMVEFTPKVVGDHLVNVEYNGKSLDGVPFPLKCFGAELVAVTNVSKCAVGGTVEFIVDASSSGEGNLEITVTANEDLNVPTQVRPLGGAKFAVCFVPNRLCPHLIGITFNGIHVPGSPFTVKVTDALLDIVEVNAMSDTLSCAVNKPARLNLRGNVSPQQLYARITNPEGSVVPFTLRDVNTGGQMAVEFTPAVVGEYRIEVRYMDQPLAGSPFIFKVYDVSKIQVSQVPSQITIGSNASFLVETAGAGPGNLEVMVNKGRVATTPQAQSISLYAIHFTPQEATLHEIEVKFNGEHVPSSPFSCNVVDLSSVTVSGEGVDRCPLGQLTTIKINTSEQNVGLLAINVSGPSNERVSAKMIGNEKIGYTVEYTPNEVGDYLIDIRVNHTPIPNSPFICKVYDPSMVQVGDIGKGTVGFPLYFSIDAAAAGAGNLEITVSVGGRNVPNFVQSEGNARFKVNFKPSEPLVHSISVKFNGVPVPGSPFNVPIQDSQQSMVSGSSLRMTSLAHGTKFTVDTKGSDKPLRIQATAPSGATIPVTLSKISAHNYEAAFRPLEVGPQQVAIFLGEEQISGSPYVCNVFDVNRVTVSSLGRGSVGKPVTFCVDASHAGEGTLELVVSTKKGSVRAEVSMRSRGVYNVTFLPTETTTHFVNITFNEEEVPGNPFRIEMIDMPRNGRKVEVRGEKRAVVGVLSAFDVEAEGEITARITASKDSLVQNSVSRVGPTTWRIEYKPQEVGTHLVEILHDGYKAKSFHVAVSDPTRVRVLDLDDGIVNKEQSFRVDTTRAGKGQIKVVIASHGKEVPHKIVELALGVYKVTFTPMKDAPNVIDLRFNGTACPGFPATVTVRDPSRSIIAHGSSLKSAQIGRTNKFYIETGGYGDAKDFDILVSSHSNSPLPVKCFSQKDASLLVEWQPNETGIYKIEVLYRGEPVNGSPFKCQAFDATKVHLQQISSTSFNVNENISIALNRRDAGYAELDVTVTSPLGRNLPIEVKGSPDGEVIEFTPSVAGKYRIAINYGGIAVPGSPVTFIAHDSGSPKVTGQGLQKGLKGTMASFRVDGRGLWGMPEIRIDGPNSEPELKIKELEEGLYSVAYLPLEVGLYEITIRWNGKDVPHSPFKAKVTEARDISCVGGWGRFLDENGVLRLIVGEEMSIPLEVGQSAGKIVAELRTPNGMIIPVNVEKVSSGRVRLYFTPIESGNYLLTIIQNGMAVANTPIKGRAADLSNGSHRAEGLDLSKVVVKGAGLLSARVGEKAEFVIDASLLGREGVPRAVLQGPSAEIRVHIQPMANHVYRACFTPTHTGSYQLNVYWGDDLLPSCPHQVTVGAICDSSRVICSGDGLLGGVVGKEIKAFIDTRKGGPGELTAHCSGPAKMAHCELFDHRDGTFTLFIKPQEGGRHLLNVKYGGNHVPGSPFTMKICGAPDASKVRVYGPGIEPGVLALYQSRFVCDTKGAGAGQLTVRIRGPKGAFRVEMQRENNKDRTILCKYDPTEPGDYRIEVRWSGDHVIGSPFLVMIFDTQEELSRHMQQLKLSSPSTHSLQQAPLLPMLGH
ncbi:filamin-C [Galendromus occidentalis]|uniref:Filamin-C n=1 Tax=Galendromus occidentalis TaxID=34638 RepID=A0AAJ7SED2_9ACAR|nr:filamin-C [Galendromus occidentalis]